MPRAKGTASLRLVAATVIGLALLSACMSPSPAVPSASGSGVQPSPPTACEGVDLRGPSGDPVNLNGRWRGPSGGTFYLRQSGSCIWFVGLDRDTGASGALANQGWVNSYFGTLESDFMLRGSWADLLPDPGSGVGVLDFRLDFRDVGGEQVTTLQVWEESGGFGDGYLVRAEERVDLTVRLRDTEECVAVISDDGGEYELSSLPPEWYAVRPLGLYGPDGEVIRLPDSFEVRGEVGRGNGDCGGGRLIFADEIQISAAP